MKSGVKEAQERGGGEPRGVGDMRRIFDDKAVDAVVIATPDHWHAPATLLACAAGKHVYVEKPCCHNIREGRLMIETARRNKMVVQTGTQSRSAPHVLEAMKRLRDGVIGDVLVAKAWNSQLRGNIGKRKASAPPGHLNFDAWLGPAPARAFQSNLLHSSWRWFHDFGTGDIGNDGVHDIDLARYGLGVERHPDVICGNGGKLFFDDDQEFPDTQYVCYEYDIDGKKKQLVYEQRIWSPYVQEGHENGNAFYGTKGYMVLGKHSGWQIFGPRNERGEQMRGGIDNAAHHRDWLECIRSGARPRADVEIGHLSAAVAHLGNITTRLGRTLRFDGTRERFIADAEADVLVGRTYREHWAKPNGDAEGRRENGTADGRR
jgi:predicted dehydrogenase